MTGDVLSCPHAQPDPNLLLPHGSLVEVKKIVPALFSSAAHIFFSGKQLKKSYLRDSLCRLSLPGTERLPREYRCYGEKASSAS